MLLLRWRSSMNILEGGLQKELRLQRGTLCFSLIGVSRYHIVTTSTTITTVCSEIKQPGNKREISIREASLVVFCFFVFCGACLFIFYFLFLCPFFRCPSRTDWIILSTGSRISVGSLRRICSPRTDGLEERMRGRSRGVEEMGVSQCSNILGRRRGLHAVDS